MRLAGFLFVEKSEPLPFRLTKALVVGHHLNDLSLIAEGNGITSARMPHDEAFL